MRRKNGFPNYDLTIKVPIFKVYMVFDDDATQFKNVISKYLVYTRYDMKFTKYTRSIIKARC